MSHFHLLQKVKGTFLQIQRIVKFKPGLNLFLELESVKKKFVWDIESVLTTPPLSPIILGEIIYSYKEEMVSA